LKDQYDEWLARVICYAFSVPASAFVSQVNRATSETLRMQATQEGLVPLKAWVKSALDQVVQVYLKQPDLEFIWVGDDAIDPLEQAQTLNILVSAGIKTREEARADLGLAPGAGGKAGALGKYNENHDERGRFATAGNAVARGGRRDSTPGRQEDARAGNAAATTPLRVAQDFSQTCAAYIAANRQAKVLRVFPGQFLNSSLQDLLAAAKAGDPAARRACKLLFDNRWKK
jgi:hypothetical protein